MAFSRSFKQYGVWACIIASALLLAACAHAPEPSDSVEALPTTATPSAVNTLLPPAILQRKSRWVAVPWTDLPGFADDTWFEAWHAWLKNCERPTPLFAPLCAQSRPLTLAEPTEQRSWLQQRLQPYRVESLQGVADGQLTSYYEPVLVASRQAAPGYTVRLYRAPSSLASPKPWFSRQDIDTLPQAQAALRGREIAWLADPIDAMLLHIQGSGRLLLRESDGSERTVRVAFGGSNEQPYRSINLWLAAQGAAVNPWPAAAKAWVAQNPERLNALLWSNPRYIFFKEEALTPQDAALGPKGAQGIALTAGRSIAVDPGSIPYGTPVWLSSRGTATTLQKLVFAQDTGSAIVGAVRADYFAGTGVEAGQLAARIHQPLRLWVLWPR